MQRYEFAQLDSTAGVPCPCGTSRRAFATPENVLATTHLVEISADARTHYHKRLTETYVILEGEGWLELDGERILIHVDDDGIGIPPEKHRQVFEAFSQAENTIRPGAMKSISARPESPSCRASRNTAR